MPASTAAEHPRFPNISAGAELLAIESITST
jgi:hypothetical protein